MQYPADKAEQGFVKTLFTNVNKGNTLLARQNKDWSSWIRTIPCLQSKQGFVSKGNPRTENKDSAVLRTVQKRKSPEVATKEKTELFPKHAGWVWHDSLGELRLTGSLLHDPKEHGTKTYTGRAEQSPLIKKPNPKKPRNVLNLIHKCE